MPREKGGHPQCRHQCLIVAWWFLSLLVLLWRFLRFRSKASLLHRRSEMHPAIIWTTWRRKLRTRPSSRRSTGGSWRRCSSSSKRRRRLSSGERALRVEGRTKKRRGLPARTCDARGCWLGGAGRPPKPAVPATLGKGQYSMVVAGVETGGPSPRAEGLDLRRSHRDRKQKSRTRSVSNGAHPWCLSNGVVRALVLMSLVSLEVSPTSLFLPAHTEWPCWHHNVVVTGPSLSGLVAPSWESPLGKGVVQARDASAVHRAAPAKECSYGSADFLRLPYSSEFLQSNPDEDMVGLYVGQSKNCWSIFCGNKSVLAPSVPVA